MANSGLPTFEIDREKMMHTMILRRIRSDRVELMRLIVKQSELMDIIFSDAPEYPFGEKTMGLIIKMHKNIVEMMEQVHEGMISRKKTRQLNVEREMGLAHLNLAEAHLYQSVDE